MHFLPGGKEIKESPGPSPANNTPPECCIISSNPVFDDKKIKDILSDILYFLAEKEGFEPSIPFWGIHDFQSCALGQLRDFSMCVQLLPTCI